MDVPRVTMPVALSEVMLLALLIVELINLAIL